MAETIRMPMCREHKVVVSCVKFYRENVMKKSWHCPEDDHKTEMHVIWVRVAYTEE